MDFSIPPTLPIELQNSLNDIIQDYKEENLTVKGYERKRRQIFERFEEFQSNMIQKPHISPSNINRNKMHVPGRNQSLSSTLVHRTGANQTNDSMSVVSPSRNSISDFHQSMYRVTTVNSTSNLSQSTGHKRMSSMQLSLPSYDIASDSSNYNPMIPLLPRELSSKSDNLLGSDSLPQILRGRFQNYEGQNAMISINAKGKETFITWEKLYLRAEKIAHELGKSKLYKMDKVLLWYSRDETIEFTVALLGSIIAEMVAVPVSFEAYSLGEIIEIMKLTSCKYILISAECYKQLDNLHSTGNNSKIKLSKNDMFDNVTFLKTDDLGTYSKAKKHSTTFNIPNICYIEFTRTPLGRLSGVVMKNQTLIDQFETLARIIDSRAMPHWKKIEVMKPANKRIPLTIATKARASRFTILNVLDPTRSTGLLFGVLFNIFTGNLSINVNEKLLETPGGYESLIDQFRADILINDQLQLKQVVINYLENPEILASRKKHKLDFSCIKCCLTSCNTIDTEVSDMVVHKWLKNLGCVDASLCYSPMLTLNDFGGIFISTRDQLGGIENFPIHNTKLRLQDEIFINKEKLRANIVEPSITAMINSSSSFKDYLKLETFGFPIPGTTLCVVNPDDSTLVPDLTVGEIWLSSGSLVDEFFQLDKVNDFVFRSRLNYLKMASFTYQHVGAKKSERLELISNICPPTTQFLRTKLMGFIHNGKIYVLSLIEDLFLQNQLIRLPNYAHTSDVLRAKNAKKISNSQDDLGSKNCKSSQSSDTLSLHSSLQKNGKRIVETHYLQQITESVVRTVDTISDVAAFELNHHKEEHFLIVVVESSAAKPRSSGNISNASTVDGQAILATERQKINLEKKMNDITDQIYRILWIFHKIQPMCIMVVPRGSLPRRYCSLELANSTVERKFVNGELDSSFVKFQFDNILLDFVPHSGYYNESIFSQHLSNMRRAYIEEAQGYEIRNKSITDEGWQTSGIDYRDTTYDTRSRGKKMSDFKSIIDVLDWRILNLENEYAFSDGGSTTSSTVSNSNENTLHKNVSWKLFDLFIATYLKKIVGSKVPLNAGDRVIIMCSNSVEYVAITIASILCNFVIIPIDPIIERTAEDDFKFIYDIVKAYKVKRVFIDAKCNNLLTNNTNVSRIFKRFKQLMPKITNISKLKRKTGISIKMFKKILKQKYSYKSGTKIYSQPLVIWINRNNDSLKNVHVTMTHATLMNTCKIIKETLQLNGTSPIFSLCSHTFGLGFMFSCFIGIYAGTVSNLFDIDNVIIDPKDFCMAVQNLNVKDLYFNLETFHIVMDRAYRMIETESRLIPQTSKAKKNSEKLSSTLRSDMFKNVKNIMISFYNRPNVISIENLLMKYQKIAILPGQISYLYQSHFNPIISLQSYLNIPPSDIFLDPVSLREGIIREEDVSKSRSGFSLRLQDSGVVPVCTDVTIVNPETRTPCLEGEVGEIWCCSEANVADYTIYTSAGKLKKDPFITEQFKSRFSKDVDNGLTYLRTGDLGFIKNVQRTNDEGELISLNLLYVLGCINETVEVLGLTHFVTDLERTVKEVHRMVSNCIIAKAGGLLVCLVKCRDGKIEKYGNLTTLIVSELLNRHGVVIDLISFVKNNNLDKLQSSNWSINRVAIMEAWFNQSFKIETQFGINYGENLSIYLLSDFENTT